MNSIPSVNPTALSLLGFLHKQPMSGLEIITAATETVGPFWSLTTSQIYSELQRLRNIGCIEQAATGAYSKRIFSLTPLGRRVFKEHINTMPGEETIRFPLLLFLQFGEFIEPSLRRDIIATHRQRHTEQLQQHRISRSNPHLSPYDQTVLDFGIRYEEGVIAWLDSLKTTLDL